MQETVSWVFWNFIGLIILFVAVSPIFFGYLFRMGWKWRLDAEEKSRAKKEARK